MVVYGVDLDGINGQLVRFSITRDDVGSGVSVLGNAGKVVREGIVRASRAIGTLDDGWSTLATGNYTLDLAPAETPKSSSGLDLPIAIMLLQAGLLQDPGVIDAEIDRLKQQSQSSNIDARRRDHILSSIEELVIRKELIHKHQESLRRCKEKYILIGKLDIASGGLEAPHYGMFGLIAAAKKGHTLIVPEDSETHGALVARATPGLRVIQASSLKEVWNTILGECPERDVAYVETRIRRKLLSRHDPPDFKSIKGVNRAKWAMIVAIAGGHNILLAGPPGQGKSMLAKAAVDLLPELEREELLELNKIYSAKGELEGNELVMDRPYLEVSHTVNPTALYGGGREHHLVPGIVSLAHNGILFFDEINLCSAAIIENLRVPLSDGSIHVQRTFKNVEYPCRFILVAAMNPCKCGWQGHYVCPHCRAVFFGPGICSSHPKSQLQQKCTCTSSMILNYKKKISRPILDRIDLKVMVSSYDDMPGASLTLASSTLRKKTQAVRDKQRKRYSGERFINCNADVPDLSRFDELISTSAEVRRYARKAASHLEMTKRQETKLFLVALTIADLESSSFINESHIDRALEFMGFGNDYFQGF